MPAISLIVPIYNIERIAPYFDTFIHSVRQQSLEDIEIILVDDASTDGTATRLQALQREDPRIKVITHSNNRGQGEARNSGTRKASGEYVWYADQDDYLAPGACEMIMHYAKACDFPDMLDFYVYWSYEDGPHQVTDVRGWLTDTVDYTLRAKTFGHQELITRFLCNLTHVPWRKVARRWLAKRVCFPRFYPEDVSHSLETYAWAQRMTKIPATLYAHRIYPDAQSRTNRRDKKDSNFKGHVHAVQLVDEVLDYTCTQYECPQESRIYRMYWRLVTMCLLLEAGPSRKKCALWREISRGNQFRYRDALLLCAPHHHTHTTARQEPERDIAQERHAVALVLLFKVSKTLARIYYRLHGHDIYRIWHR